MFCQKNKVLNIQGVKEQIIKVNKPSNSYDHIRRLYMPSITTHRGVSYNSAPTDDVAVLSATSFPVRSWSNKGKYSK